MGKQPKSKAGVMTLLLEPHGFKQGEHGLFWRESGRGITAVESQPARMSSGFFINVAWTMKGLPSFSAGSYLGPERMQLLDYVFRGRVHEIIRRDPPVPFRFESGKGAAERRDQLQAACEIMIQACDEIDRHFNEPERLIASLPAEMVALELQERLARSGQVRPAPTTHGDSIRAALHGFHGHIFELSYWLHYLCNTCGRTTDAKEYLRIASEVAVHDFEKRLVK